jgi:hypothetical protein
MKTIKTHSAFTITALHHGSLQRTSCRFIASSNFAMN